jgi:signal transduction histidine kinase
MFNVTTRMLATHSLDELTSVSLDAITNQFGYPQAAIGLIDERNAVLKMRMATGFMDNAEVERLEIPLDSAASGLSVIFDGRPVRIGSDSNDPLVRLLAQGESLLAFPLFGALDGNKGEFARRELGEHKYWEPASMCLGVLYVGATSTEIDQPAITMLQHFADRIGAIIAYAVQTERLMKTVTKLQRERLWVESVMQSAADPVVLTNLDNEILLQNRRAEALFSGSEGASEGKRRALKMNDLLFSAFLSSAAVSSTEILGRDLTLVDPIEGADIHFEVISTPAHNELGERIGLVSVFRDVTDLREANQELARNYRKLKQADAEARRERDRLNLIIENVGHPVVVTDVTGNFVLFNRRAGMLFQPEPASTGDDKMLFVDADSSVSRSLAAVRTNSVKLTSFISGLASEMRAGRQAEIELIDPESGELLPMEITSEEVRDSEQTVTAVVSVLHDLSGVRELERSRLEQKLFESDKLAAVGTLAASIAHEVNNPLEAIKNSLYLLQTKKDQTSDKFLGIALKETERVSQIVQRMLGFARRAGGIEWVDLNQLIEETVALVERKLRQSGIKVTKKLDADLPNVQGYPDQLRQVCLNLILNAQQAMEDGGRVEIRTSALDESGQPYAAIEIKDTGCGVSEQELSRIFEPFFSMRKDGTGLGLWVTQNIVRQHGGRIEVASREKKGTTFRIVLPVDAPAPISAGKQEQFNSH